MKIKKLKKLSYLETQGGTICICDSNNKLWNGTETENSDYWKVNSSLSVESGFLITYKRTKELYFILNNENSGFLIFTNDWNDLIILEIFYIDESDIEWENQEFEILNESIIELNLINGCLIYDSALSIKDLPKKEGFFQINHFVNNFYRTNKPFSKLKKISIKNMGIHLEGVILS